MVMVLLGALVGCSKEEPPAAAPAADAALKITGKVDQELSWTEEEVRAMGTIEAESTNTAGETATYGGTPVNTLLDEAGVGGDATTLVLVGDDGQTAGVDLAEVRACDDCIASFRNRAALAR
jgi:DMSO/TMAO reductase YedYZ molybdopterin-dependent catalytic subunit